MRRVAPLTDTLIRKSKIKETDYTLADGNGLHLLIQNNGIKNGNLFILAQLICQPYIIHRI